jgi:pyruvate, water dikinase
MRIIKKGKGVSQGQATGKVKIIKNFEDFSKVQEGDVLVTKMTDPTMTVIMGKANAIITETGGMACHAAIVARELGIPCVVAFESATETLKEGSTIHVCGTTGNVQKEE